MIKIGLLGFGNVGQGVFNILSKNQPLLKARINDDIQIKTIAVRSPDKYKHLDINNATLTTNPNDIINDPEIDIVVELMGGEFPAFDLISNALKNGKDVVTANKEVVSKHKSHFFQCAKENNSDIYFEAAVGGAIPIIRSLKVGFAANKITAIYGILNGTTNYILSKIMAEKQEFKEVLKQAQELGLAEADPTMDVEGIDAAHKLVILSAVSFKANIKLDDIYVEGITQITLTDMQYAHELGYTIKLLAIGKKEDQTSMIAKVHPVLVPNTHPIANVQNEMNAIYVEGDFIGEAMLQGKGAGGDPTGSAVVSDIIDVALDKHTPQTRRSLEPELFEINCTPINSIKSQFYTRIETEDKPHVLETVSGTFADKNISISKLIQKESTETTAEIVIITHQCTRPAIQQVLDQLKQDPNIISISPPIHVGL